MIFVQFAALPPWEQTYDISGCCGTGEFKPAVGNFQLGPYTLDGITGKMHKALVERT
jgi:hypothetical protein